MVLTWCLLSSCILLLIPHGVTSKLQFSFARLMSRPLRISRSLSLQALTPINTAVSPRDYQKIVTENRKLQNTLNHLEVLRQEKNREIERLTHLRTLPDEAHLGFILSDVVIPLKKDQLRINRGKRDGVRLDQFVLSENAVIGTISEINTHMARVLLFSDEKSRIPAFITSEKTLGTLVGKGNGVIKIVNVRRTQNVKIGDVIYTPKQPGLLETPFQVGTVSDIKADSQEPLLWDISVTMASDPGQAATVDVITSGSLDDDLTP